MIGSSLPRSFVLGSVLAAVASLSAPPTASAFNPRKAWNEAREKYLDPAGDKLEREARRARDQAIEMAKKVEAEARRARERIEEIQAKIVDLRQKFVAIKQEVRERRASLSSMASDVKEKSKRAGQRLSEIKRIATQDLEPATLLKVASLSMLEASAKKAAESGKLEAFLNHDLVKHVRVIDVLAPSHGIVERLDVTGVTQCTRERAMRDYVQNPSADPNAVRSIVSARAVECLEAKPADGSDASHSQTTTEAETAQAAKDAQDAQASLAADEERLALEAEYQREIEAQKARALAVLEDLTKVSAILEASAEGIQKADEYLAAMQSEEPSR